MQEYVIVAESGSDIPRELAEKHNIYIVPMHVTFGNITKKDGHFPPAEVCMYYERTGAVPLTSGCNPGDFAEVFARIDKEHPDCHILYLAYSAVTTCAYRSAEIAAEGRKNISFINTKLLTVGQCAAVVRLAEELEAHPEWSLAEIEAQAVRICASVEMSCLISNIDYMRAGGRVTNSAALIGNIFNIHPEIILDKDGYIKAGKNTAARCEKRCSSSWTTTSTIVIWTANCCGWVAPMAFLKHLRKKPFNTPIAMALRRYAGLMPVA